MRNFLSSLLFSRPRRWGAHIIGVCFYRAATTLGVIALLFCVCAPSSLTATQEKEKEQEEKEQEEKERKEKKLRNNNDAQSQTNPRIDSLRRVLETQNEQERHRTLMQLCWEYRAVNPSQAVSYGRRAIELIEKHNISRDLAQAQRFLGVAYRNLGDYGTAIEYFFSSLALDEQNNGNPVEIGHSLNSIARIFVLQNKPAEALAYLERGLKIAKTYDDKRLLAYCLTNMAEAKILLAEYSEALTILFQAIRLWETPETQPNLAAALSDIGLAFYSLKNYQAAQDYYIKALAIFKRFDQPHDMSKTLARMSWIQIALGANEQALRYAERALIYARQSQSRQQIKDALEILVVATEKMGNTAATLQYYRLLKEAGDSLYTETSARQTAIYSAKYEYERKEQQILALEKEARQQTILRNILIVAGLLLLLSLALLVNRFRLKHRAEEILRLRAEELAQANKELRIAKLEIEEQNKLLIDLDKEKSEILMIAAHDLKNPVSAIHGIAEMLQHDDFPPAQVKKLSSVIMDNSRHMFELITNLLDINAIESGQLLLQPVVFNANIMLSGVVDRFDHPSALKNIHVDLSLPEHNIYLHADKNATIQIIENLLSNAVKYSPPGSRVLVRLRDSYILQTNRIWTREEWLRLDGDDLEDLSSYTERCVRFEIQDFGPGLTEKDKALLFTKFARLSAEPTANEHSTGLGLSIVKKLTELLGGRVWCESTFGEGATFIVELPAASESFVEHGVIIDEHNVSF
jgi:signal transduction histidine kinase